MPSLTTWLKKCSSVLLSGLLFTTAIGQVQPTLTLEQAYGEARDNYPAIQQKDLLRKTADLSIANLGTQWLPQLAINGQATYQSQVTSVGVSIPGVTIPSPAKDQYKITADLSQTIYDGGVVKQQKAIRELNAAVQDQQVEVTLYQVKQRINQLYLGILYLDDQLKQVELVRQDLQTGIHKLEAQVANGVAFKSGLHELQAEFLKADQRRIELAASRSSALNTLALFLGHPLGEKTVLELPATPVLLTDTITRPELKLYDSRSKLIGQQDKLISAKNLPRTSLFVQGGYGRPGLNMLSNQFDWFYIAGVRLNWSLGGLYTSKREKAITDIDQRMVDVEEETFLLNTRAQLTEQAATIHKLEQLIGSDSAIINLRNSVKEAARAQLDNAVITASDYLREVNAEDQARQTLITHRLQLLQARIDYKTLSGM